MIKNKTINAEEMGYVSPRAKVITLMMSHSLLQDSLDGYNEGPGFEDGDNTMNL